tara:strand:- start:579 stop:1496 length:918 start_codon:yes stop_codon:yes gene_type:complete
MEFVLTGVRHKLENNQWVTSLDSIATVTNLLSTKDLQKIDISISNLITTAGTVGKVNGKTTVAISNDDYPIIISTDNQKQKDVYKNKYKYTKEFIIRKGNNNPDSNVMKFVNFLENKTVKRIIIKPDPDDTSPGGQLGNGGDITEDLLKALYKLYDVLGKPEYSLLKSIRLTAGNDKFHQGKTLSPTATYPRGSVTPASTTHTRGLAIDIGSKGTTPLNNLVVKACKDAGFTGVVFHNSGDGAHTHANIPTTPSIVEEVTSTLLETNAITSLIPEDIKEEIVDEFEEAVEFVEDKAKDLYNFLFD